jgi:hypothetical protein
MDILLLLQLDLQDRLCLVLLAWPQAPFTSDRLILILTPAISVFRLVQIFCPKSEGTNPVTYRQGTLWEIDHIYLVVAAYLDPR